MKHLFLAILLLFPITAYSQHGHAPAKAPVALATGLGDINHPVSTSNPEAQKFFNQGLAYVYAFNHEEAVRSFKQAAQLDPHSPGTGKPARGLLAVDQHGQRQDRRSAWLLDDRRHGASVRHHYGDLDLPIDGSWNQRRPTDRHDSRLRISLQ